MGAWSTASAYGERAVYWQGSQHVDLNSLLPANSDWVLNEAVSINENGLIVGNGIYKGQATAFAVAAATLGD